MYVKQSFGLQMSQETFTKPELKVIVIESFCQKKKRAVKKKKNRNRFVLGSMPDSEKQTRRKLTLRRSFVDVYNKDSACMDLNDDNMHVWMSEDTMRNCALVSNMQCCGGMQNGNIITCEPENFQREIKILIRLFGDSIDSEELQQKMQHYNGNIELVIKEIVRQSVERETKLDEESKMDALRDTEQVKKKNVSYMLLFNAFQKKKNKKKRAASESDESILSPNGSRNKSLQREMEKAEVGETKAGINLQGYCANETCLASRAKLPVWINIGFDSITFTSSSTAFCCPDCKKSTINLIVKAIDDSIPVQDNNYQCSYTIKSGLSYELKANKIKQHAKSIEDLRERSESAMSSIEIRNLITELRKYEITVVKPPSLKGNERLLEKIRVDYGGDFNQAFDIGRFTILCDNSTKLQTAVAVMKKAEQFNLIVSEDKDFFSKQSRTHHRFHNIKLYVPKHDVYIEMQATLKNYTTLEGYAVIDNPKLSHLFYEQIRVWKPIGAQEEELKQASDEALTKINDIICEWIDEREIRKIASRCKPHSEIGLLKPPQLRKYMTNEQADTSDISQKLANFVYEQLCNFIPTKIKCRAIYVILLEYFKEHIIGKTNPACCADVAFILQAARENELEEDIAISQALETYIPLQANNYPYIDSDDNKKNDAYDCYQHVINFLKEDGKSDQQSRIMILQGKSGSGKSLFCRHLEECLWKSYDSHSTKYIPVYISLPKCYNELNEAQIIAQALQMKQINKDMISVIRENISFVFILDEFDEIFDRYNKSNAERYFYNRFNLHEWNAKIITTCRSHVLNEEDIKQVLLGPNNLTTSMVYLWPFSNEQMHGYIDKFVTMNKKNKFNEHSDWTTRQYEKTLKNYPNLHKMVEEPFLLRMILTVLPALVKQHSIGTKISKAQVYEAFNEQWTNLHAQNIANKLAELRIQTNLKKIKAAFQEYCQNLAFEMFIQGNQIATEADIQYRDSEIIINEDSKVEMESKISMKICR
ncbi:hypothetical protein RFI_30176 [Reticulomyxa filosa]|uniref:NACHT domain-containing protein n=1 Tax=Reticulomyxa filosa TaxID=46433 RepID=X6M0S4_RETFI|nr:hypothetical protein RFI_30176 [Reticulomyxa filosa]|eukprot:ETO07216.1 hypothetical protein RFI_30176 [Reticulomyxa filosa]